MEDPYELGVCSMLLGLNNHVHIYNQIIDLVRYILYTVLSLLNVIVLLSLTILSNHCEKVCKVCKTCHIFCFPFLSSPLNERQQNPHHPLLQMRTLRHREVEELV